MTKRERIILISWGVVALIGVFAVWKLNITPGEVESVTVYADDLERVRAIDVNKHFRSIFGRTPSIAEWRYWYERTKDTPVLIAYLDAMKSYHAAGDSPSVEDSDFVPGTSPIRMSISTAGRYLFEGDRVNIKITMTNDGPIRNKGFLETSINTTEVRETVPAAGKITAPAEGTRLLRHGYDLDKGESITITVPITVPSPKRTALIVPGYDKPVLRVQTKVKDVGNTMTETFRVVGAITENQASLSYAQRQVPIIFLHVFDELPTSAERTYWRAQLPRLNDNLGALKGAMEVAHNAGRTTN